MSYIANRLTAEDIRSLMLNPNSWLSKIIQNQEMDEVLLHEEIIFQIKRTLQEINLQKQHEQSGKQIAITSHAQEEHKRRQEALISSHPDSRDTATLIHDLNKLLLQWLTLLGSFSQQQRMVLFKNLAAILPLSANQHHSRKTDISYPALLAQLLSKDGIISLTVLVALMQEVLNTLQKMDFKTSKVFMSNPSALYSPFLFKPKMVRSSQQNSEEEEFSYFSPLKHFHS